MPVRVAYQKLPLIVPLRWLTLTLSEWLVVALSWLKKGKKKESERGRGLKKRVELTTHFSISCVIFWLYSL